MSLLLSTVRSYEKVVCDSDEHTFRAGAELAAQQRQDQFLGHSLALPTTPSMALWGTMAYIKPLKVDLSAFRDDCQTDEHVKMMAIISESPQGHHLRPICEQVC